MPRSSCPAHHYSWDPASDRARALLRPAVSLAYLDPGNLENNLQQGAYTQYRLVWVLWWATCTGYVLQEMSARLGVVTGRDLAQTVRAEYPRWLCSLIYFMMEVAVIGSDIQEVSGLPCHDANEWQPPCPVPIDDSSVRRPPTPSPLSCVGVHLTARRRWWALASRSICSRMGASLCG